MEPIIESDRDRRAYEWLVDQVGAEAVDHACLSLAGLRKPYISNLAKVLGLQIPEELAFAARDTAKKHLAAMRNLLDGGVK